MCENRDSCVGIGGWKQKSVREAFGNDGWDEFIYWAQRIYAWPEWEVVERASKLRVADGLRHARAAVLRHAGNWRTQLRSAVGTPNQLTNWNLQAQFLAWADGHPEDALSALNALWNSAAPVDERVNTFACAAPDDVVHGNPLPLASFLLMGEDPTIYAVSRPQPYDAAYQLTHFAPRHAGRTPGDKYLQRLEFLDTFMSLADASGCLVRDRLDAQGLVWSITRWDPKASPIGEWPKPDRARLVAWRATVQEPYSKLLADERV
jgi:hypothetical protein